MWPLYNLMALLEFVLILGTGLLLAESVAIGCVWVQRTFWGR